MRTVLEAQFGEAIMNVYRRALSECDHNATRFHQMLYEHRGLETARIFLRAAKVLEGYVALWERGRLDLTVEAEILAPQWESLFSEKSVKSHGPGWQKMDTKSRLRKKRESEFPTIRSFSQKRGSVRTLRPGSSNPRGGLWTLLTTTNALL